MAGRAAANVDGRSVPALRVVVVRGLDGGREGLCAGEVVAGSDDAEEDRRVGDPEVDGALVGAAGVADEVVDAVTPAGAAELVVPEHPESTSNPIAN